MSTIAQPKSLQGMNKRSRQAGAPDLKGKFKNRFPYHHQKKACFPINEIHVINFFHKQPSADWISMSDLRPLAGKLAGAI